MRKLLLCVTFLLANLAMASVSAAETHAEMCLRLRGECYTQCFDFFPPGPDRTACYENCNQAYLLCLAQGG
jgi:hypothetical protein